jgi:hypothetical protein
MSDARRSALREALAKVLAGADGARLAKARRELRAWLLEPRWIGHRGAGRAVDPKSKSGERR